jgi:RNA polymerase sigma-70 factor (subfamily 1)
LNDDPTADDHALFARAAAGDQDALGALLVRNLPWLEAYLRLHAGGALRRKEALSDLVQSVCVAALRDLRGFEFRGEPQFRHWLCQQALHKVINKREFHGAAKRDVAKEVAFDQPGTGGGSSPMLACYATLCTPSRHASGREEIARVEAAFDGLPAEHREAITLRRIVGLDYPEIAAAMGKSEGAVRNLVYRGTARLGALLDGPPGARDGAM